MDSIRDKCYKPIKTKDRDWEVLSKLAVTELGAKDDIEVYEILKEYENNRIHLDAESFVIFYKKYRGSDPSYYSYDILREVVKERLNLDESEDLDEIQSIIRTLSLSPLYGVYENTAREFFIKNSKEYKKCQTEQEKEDYVKKYY